jgi:hypothetical protein
MFPIPWGGITGGSPATGPAGSGAGCAKAAPDARQIATAQAADLMDTGFPQSSRRPWRGAVRFAIADHRRRMRQSLGDYQALRAIVTNWSTSGSIVENEVTSRTSVWSRGMTNPAGRLPMDHG